MRKTATKILKIIWFIIGGIILFWTSFFYIKMQTQGDLGVIAIAIFFGIGIYALIIFLFATLLYLLIKYIIKKWTNKKSSKQGVLQKK